MAQSSGPARVDDSLKDAAYDCPMPRSPEATIARATKLSKSTWDKNDLGCAADMWFAVANATTSDPAAMLAALLAATAYIDHINTLWSYDLYGIREPEWSARIRHASDQGSLLETKLAAAAPDDPNALAARALFMVTWPAKIATARTQLSESKAALALLDRAIAGDPGALEGNALWLTGRLYYDLPAFVGGDPSRGVQLLADAYRRTPDNAGLLRYSAYVLTEERDFEAARKRLTAMVSLPAEGDLQLLADELKGASELAARLKYEPLGKELTAKRNALLRSHPQLLRRENTAANMHGGVDPITGKDY